jgi:hypothetical protein
MTCSAAATVSSMPISNNNFSIPNKVASRLVASVLATASADRLVASVAAVASADVFASVVASVLAVGAILDTEAEGGVFSIAYITLPILLFFSPSAFFVAEGSCFF